ncbi:putative MFS family arabinose efflux permease [Actinocorallia herbida]|uniref:Putative MFS family arabinose efflux permease n=1 Tax=Actinocorallia herbida TaxID=58109 RepID=A0A3N1DCN5_9ACTN|nr:MFS transporter [Actinocorallia herbida]ROO91284.1 putative MFS family arabinose efflux permease [Actinocorallia herbida]
MKLLLDVTPLRNPAYRRLWIGNGVSFIGFQVTGVAVPVQVWHLTASSFWVGMLSMVTLVPLIVFGLWGGAVADHMDRRRLLMWSSVLTWVATLALLAQAVLRLDQLWIIMLVTALQSTGFAVSSPTRGAIIPRLFDAAQIPAANTLTYTFTQAATLAGPLLAGVILATGSYAWAYALDAVLFTVMLWAAFRLPSIPPQAGAAHGTPGLRSVLDGLRFLRSQPVLLLSFVVDIIAMGVAMPRALFPELAQTRFGDSPDGGPAVGWLYAAIGIGAVLGGLFSGWIGRVRRQGLALIVAVAAWGVAVALAGLQQSLWLAVLFLALGGVADLVSAVFRQTILQTYAPDEMRGRVQGIFTVVVAGGPRLGDLRAGLMAVAFGAGVSWVLGGIACAVLVLVVGAVFPALARYHAPGGGPEERSPAQVT